MTDHGAQIAASFGVTRSGEWPRVARLHLDKHAQCVACTRPSARVDVHHIFPFHFCVALGRADLELDERNLVTLCSDPSAGDHHLLLGHFDDYASMNLAVRHEAAYEFHGWLARRIRDDARWQELVAARPTDLGDMSAKAKRNLRALMDRVMPVP